MSHSPVHDLAALTQELLADAQAAGGGRASRTIFGETGETLHQTVIALLAGRGLAEHANPGQGTVQVLLGAVTLHGGPEPMHGSAGTVLAIPDGPHSLTTDQDAVLLLTVARV